MLKYKYVFWGFVGLWVVGLAAGGGWFVWHARATKAASASLAASSDDTSTGASGPITISAGNSAGVPLSDGSSSSSTAASADRVNKLLDPTTFGTYNSHVSDKTASYSELNAGSGTAVVDGSQVNVLYKGWLTNGTLFDQSRAGSDGKLQAFTFTEGQHQVIAGWEEGLEGAKPNSVRLLVVPPAAGYGATGQGPIPGNAVLVFQVQVISVR